MGGWHFAGAIGLPLNRHITIHLGRLGIPDDDASRVITEFLKIMGDRLRKWGGGFAAIWARENGSSKGSHVHIFAHIPGKFSDAFTRAQCRWVEKVAGRRLVRGTLRGRQVRGSQGAGAYQRAIAEQNAGNVARYLAKGTNSDVAAQFGLSKLERGGAIIGKRCGTTQNIGRGAWRRAGWQ